MEENLITNKNGKLLINSANKIMKLNVFYLIRSQFSHQKHLKLRFVYLYFSRTLTRETKKKLK